MWGTAVMETRANPDWSILSGGLCEIATEE